MPGWLFSCCSACSHFSNGHHQFCIYSHWLSSSAQPGPSSHSGRLHDLANEEINAWHPIQAFLAISQRSHHAPVIFYSLNTGNQATPILMDFDLVLGNGSGMTCPHCKILFYSDISYVRFTVNQFKGRM